MKRYLMSLLLFAAVILSFASMIFAEDAAVPTASDGVQIMDEIEIISEKVRAIMTRNKARDVYDLWFLLKKGIKPDMGLINQKLKIYRMKFEFDNFVRLIDEKKATWDMDLR